MDTKKCSSCNVDLALDQFGSYKVKNGTIKLRSECKACRVKREAHRNKAHPEKHNEYAKKWKQDNKDSVRAYENKRVKEKRQTDEQFKLRTDLTSHLRHFITETRKTIKHLNCNFQQFKTWFGYQFKPGMSWDDKKTWEVDHVIPLSYFDLKDPEQYKIACHWTNTRPITSENNKLKSNHVQLQTIIDHMDTIKKFLKNHNGYQVCMATCIWQTVEVWYGKNAQDEERFMSFLKWAIRSQAV
jgi:hypothetical protein